MFQTSNLDNLVENYNVFHLKILQGNIFILCFYDFYIEVQAIYILQNMTLFKIVIVQYWKVFKIPSKNSFFVKNFI